MVNYFNILVGLASFAGRYVVPAISFFAALQDTGFGQVDPWSSTSPMNIGKLRKATAGLTLWLMRHEPVRHRDQPPILGWMCLSFLVGARGGCPCTLWSERYALLPCMVLVTVGFLLTWRVCRRRQQLP